MKEESLDGLHSYCKSCISINQGEYRIKNKDLIKERNKKYREIIKIEYPNKHKESNRKYRLGARGQYTRIEQRYKNRGKHQLNISYTDFESWYNKQEQKCFYCNISLDDFIQFKDEIDFGGIKRIWSFGIDRKNSLVDYTIDNIVISCPICNYLKGWFFDSEEFLWIANKYIKKYYKNLML